MTGIGRTELVSAVVVAVVVSALCGGAATVGAAGPASVTAGTTPGADDTRALAGSATPSAQTTSTTIAGTQVSPDDVLLRVDLRSDGTATWVVEYRIRLEDENATAGFESIRADIENDSETFAAPFEDRMQATAADAENATGRDMAIRNLTVDASRQQLPQEYGVITYRFEWTGFAAVDGDRLRAGDAIAGLFLDRQSTLIVGWPADYRATETSPTPDEVREDAVVWIGPTDFTRSQPTVVVAPGTPTATPGDSTTVDAGSGDGGGDDGDTDDSGGLPWTVVVLALLVVAAAVAAVVYYRRDDRTAGVSAPADAVDDRRRPGAAADSPPSDAAADAASEADGEHPPDDATESAAGNASPAESTQPNTPPEELLSNEERVLKLLNERGGRMKQQDVAGALDWTDAKTSQVLKKMREAGDVEAFRLGRENVLTLPDQDVVPDEDGSDGSDDTDDS